MKFVKELEKYSIDYLNEVFSNDELAIRKLLDKKIIKINDKGEFSFDYVGVIIFNDKAYFSFPKYVTRGRERKCIPSILKMFTQYTQREKLDKDDLETFGDLDSESNYNALSTMIFILNDFVENGIYTNEKHTHEINGEGDINWSKTIEDFIPLISKGNVLYLEYFTDARMVDDENYFMKLHKYIITECVKRLVNYGLLNFLGFDAYDFGVEKETLGNTENIIIRLNNELSQQFVSKKQILLKAMISYIKNEVSTTDDNSVSFYGTRNFNIVWEKVCGYILDNEYNNYKNYIEKPLWRIKNVGEYESDRMKPDIICTTNDTLAIFDAKYYKLGYGEKTIKDNPGVQDIAKQYLYHIALKKIIEKKKINFVKNIFLFPIDDEKITYIGTVSISFLENITSENIQLFGVPTEQVFQLYSKGNKIDVESFLNCEIQLIN